MFYRVHEGSTVATSPDLVRPIDAPSRGLSIAARIFCQEELVARVGRFSGAALNARGSARALA
jgi:hypothetical protein